MGLGISSLWYVRKGIGSDLEGRDVFAMWRGHVGYMSCEGASALLLLRDLAILASATCRCVHFSACETYILISAFLEGDSLL